MATARSSSGHHAPAAGNLDQATWHRHRASMLFEKDHAYAARLVEIGTTIRSIVRPTMTNGPDQVPSEVQEDDGIAAGTVRLPQPYRTGAPHRGERSS
jgi:hypothetical protein